MVRKSVGAGEFAIPAPTLIRRARPRDGPRLSGVQKDSQGVRPDMRGSILGRSHPSCIEYGATILSGRGRERSRPIDRPSTDPSFPGFRFRLGTHLIRQPKEHRDKDSYSYYQLSVARDARLLNGNNLRVVDALWLLNAFCL